MKRGLFAAAILTAFISGAPVAEACAPWIATDPVTGETYRSGSPEWLRREQSGWGAGSSSTVVAQIRAARMVHGDELEFTLVPIAALDDHTVPDTELLFRWSPGNTCNPFPLAITDYVVVYAAMGADGWSIVGMTTPDLLQDRPPGFTARMREIRRDVAAGPVFAD